MSFYQHDRTWMELQPIPYPPKTYHHHYHSVTINETPTHHVQQSYTPQQMYSHLSLPRNPSPTPSIRVLDLDLLPPSPVHDTGSRPSWSRGQQPLTGTLRVVNFATCPNYTALSYVWGSDSDKPEQKITLRCDDSRGNGGGGI